MACKYTYKGVEYTEEEFRMVLKAMPRPELQKYVPSATTPSAPFVTSTDAWVELGLKQAIRMAVEGGYDRIAWTTGEQQKERYPLSNTVRSIEVYGRTDAYTRQSSGRSVNIEMLDGNGIVLGVGSDGVVDNVRGELPGGRVIGKPLDEVIGKDMAEKIMAAEIGTVIKGDGLDVGGKGMYGFYDKILPTVAKKVSKRLGGDGVVSDVDLGSRGNKTIRLGSRGVQGKSMPQQSISITPEMRAKVLQGVPLMQDNKASVEFGKNGEAIIRALKSPDASTGIHELAHVARRMLFDKSIPEEQRKGITNEHIKTAEEWAGAKDGNWTREAEEKFARGFERYLRDGNAPTEGLKEVFAKFAQWLREVYSNLFSSPVKEMISPEMRKVYDALVTRSEKAESAAIEPEASLVGRFSELEAMRDRITEPGGNRKIKKREMENWLEQNPDIKAVEDNFAAVVTRLKEEGRLKVECP